MARPSVNIPTIKEFYAGEDFGQPASEERLEFMKRRFKAALEGRIRSVVPLPAQVDFEKVTRLADGLRVQAVGSPIQGAMDAINRLERALYRYFPTLAVQEVIAFWSCEQIRSY